MTNIKLDILFNGYYILRKWNKLVIYFLIGVPPITFACKKYFPIGFPIEILNIRSMADEHYLTFSNTKILKGRCSFEKLNKTVKF